MPQIGSRVCFCRCIDLGKGSRARSFSKEPEGVQDPETYFKDLFNFLRTRRRFSMFPARVLLTE